MSSNGAQMLQALADRLATITTSNSYLTNVKGVRLNASTMDLKVPDDELPIIEIVNDTEVYEHQASSLYSVTTSVILLLIAEKAWTDGQMEDFKSDIRKCLFGGSSNATGNTGITLGGLVTSITMKESRSDLNMIEANRIYTFTINVHSKRTTYRD